jgi:hypothetical protein
VSPNVVALAAALAIRNAVLVRDADGHGLVVGER